MKCNGINGFRRLAMYHKDTLRANLHPVIVALLAEVSKSDPCGEKICPCVTQTQTQLHRHSLEIWAAEIKYVMLGTPHYKASTGFSSLTNVPSLTSHECIGGGIVWKTGIHANYVNLLRYRNYYHYYHSYAIIEII